MPASLPHQPAQEAAVIWNYHSLPSATGIGFSHIRHSRELLQRQWLDMGGISCLNMPGVKGTIAEGVTDLMKADPSPEFGRAVPFYIPHRDRFARLMLQGSVYA